MCGGGGRGGGKRWGRARLAARVAGGEDGMSLLSVGAAVVDVGVREASAPHHNSSKSSVALVLGDEGGELIGGDVVDLSGRRAVGGERSSRNTNEDLGTSGRSSGDVCDPFVVVEGSVAVEAEGAGFETLIVETVVVVIELNPQVVKLRGADNNAHVWLRERALRSYFTINLMSKTLGQSHHLPPEM